MNAKISRRWVASITALGLVFSFVPVGAAVQSKPAEESQGADPGPAIDSYRERMVRQAAQDATPRDERNYRYLSDSAARVIRPADSQSSLPERRALLTTPFATSQPTAADVLAEIPDPTEATAVFARRMERIQKTSLELRVVNSYRRVSDKATIYLARLRHGKPVSLTLAECIQRTLANNYSIRFEAFSPAISQSQLVQAEAAFDAVFFLDAGYNKADRAGTQIDGDTPQVDTRNYGGGIRKLLPSGMTVQTGFSQTRTFARVDEKQNITHNPAWESVFNVQFNQPLLRGFGLDYNRAAINLRRLDMKVSREQFLITVRDRLFSVEEAYWRLGQARRVVLILGETTGQNGTTYENMEARRSNDATPIEVNNALSRWKQAEVDYLNAVKAVLDAEDVLKNLMNDPEFLLSQPIEIIPIDTPLVSPMTIDQFAEVRRAIDERSEIKQAKLAIEQARIGTQRAKSDTLPRLDLAFRYEVQGLRGSADSSFDLLTANRYNSYAVTLQFEVPIGQRRERAALREAEMREMQAVVRLKQIMDAVVQDVNNAVRDLNIGWENIPAQQFAASAADRSLRAFQERAERTDAAFLQTELSQIENVANTRSQLARLIADYNIAIAALERAKGTLLRYNNVIVADEPARR